jgi:hypothetical protein
MAVASMVSAADNIVVKDVRITKGNWNFVLIELNNDAEYVAFQYDLYLPDGVTYGGCWKYGERIPESTTLSDNQLDNGCYRVLAASMTGLPITGNSGPMTAFNIWIEDRVPLGSMTAYLRNVKLSKADGSGITFSELPFTITVVESSIIRIKDCSRQYGDENPKFEYTVEGGELDGEPDINCYAGRYEPVGTYPIEAWGGSYTNTSVTIIPGTMTITKAPLTIKANDYTIKQGDFLPTFEATYEGFKNDEGDWMLDPLPKFSTTATSNSAPGVYEITVKGADAQNYEISYVAGKLTIEGPDFIPGDANGDTRVNVSDIVEMVNYILGKPSSKFQFEPSDVNGDGQVNVTDIVNVVNIIMSSGSRSRQRGGCPEL